MACHQNQGDNPSKFKEIGDNGCTSCHTNTIGSNKISAQAQNMYTHYKKFLAVTKN
ncbi:hypothetical protein [Campylobacter concisus]|uniref:hypothetical protein n=1 Tax=Campylobacter concisus TaxID=199 RepID=UPI001CB74079|nr:hypothetical protein [Campylobacter concisus]